MDKEEKLRKRREQLAAWKKKQEQEKINEATKENGKPENQVPENSKKQEIVPDKVIPPTKDSAEEKRRKRLDRLEEWKKKNQASNDSKSSRPEITQLQRIEEWKKKKQASPSPSAPTLPSSSNGSKLTLFSLKKIKPKSSSPVPNVPKKRAFLDSEDTDELRPKFKKPSMKETKTKDQDERNDSEDEIDKYMKSLEKNEDQGVLLDEDIPEIENEPESEEEETDEQRLRALQLKLQNKEKDLKAVDHSQIEYQPFRKSFYKETSQVKKLTPEQIEEIRTASGIRVRGNDCAAPIQRWSHLGLSSSVMEIIENNLQYTKPSPIQSQALPVIMSGRDIIGIAKTGSGKTMAFVLPLLRHVKDQPALKKGDGPIGLIMTPTRELALQIHKELSNFLEPESILACCCYGGSSIESQIAELKRGAQIIVGTPGRIIDLLAANSGRVTNLQRVTYVVLDEADRMFDLGFEPQVTKILTQIRPDRQTILFSATFPRKMELLAKKILINPVEISVGGISVVAAEIVQRIEIFDDGPDVDDLKFDKLQQILVEFAGTKVLIFVEKQSAADELLVKLLGSNYVCLAIHGGKDQVDRKYAIKEFSSATSGVNILIATSIAARGLDVKGLDLVINYDAPNHMEDYVHRVGRTGRAGNLGTAITFVSSKQERAATDLVKALKLSGETNIPARLKEISEKFIEKVKAGKENYYLGFGGRGLDNLQELRNNARDIERKVYGEETGNEAKVEKASPTVEAELPDFNIHEGRAHETAGPERCKFHSRITINDLPQKARWAVVNRENLGKIIETTSTSITNKGQYYGPNVPVKEDVPKLYLLVEGLTEKSVKAANDMIKESMIKGLESAARDEGRQPIGKYSV